MMKLKQRCYHFEENKLFLLYKKSLEIRQETLPPSHPGLASIYNKIGAAYYSLGDDPKALSSYKKST
jgi:hypothetical protein